jgi:hypothetical protein
MLVDLLVLVVGAVSSSVCLIGLGDAHKSLASSTRLEVDKSLV